MDSTTQTSVRERFRTSFRERGAAFVCAVAIEILLVLLFLFALMPALAPKAKKEPPLFGFDVSEGEAIEPTSDAKAEDRQKAGSGKQVDVATPAEPVETPPIEVPETKAPANILWLSPRDYSRADIAKAPARGSDAPVNDQGPGRSTAGDSRLAGGSGPNGEPLYVAEWHREPTDAQLGPYIPARARGRSGWGLIACRTAANYRVEDCIELGDSPRGSGFAGAVRQAAFQFLVRPPRKGGKTLVGEWVAIRITYSEASEPGEE